MDVRRAAATLAVAGASALVTVLTAGTPWLYLWWVVVPGLSVFAVAAGIRRHRPEQLLPWLVLLGALTLLWLGWSMSASIGAGVGSETMQDIVALVRDHLYVVAYPSLGVASVLMVRARTGGEDRDNLIDALIVMVALATVLGSSLFDTRTVGTVGALDRVWVTVSPLLLAAVVSASIRVLFAAGSRLPAAWLLLTSSALTLFGNLWTTQLIRDGSPTQVTGIDVLWVLGFVAVGAAALHPSMRDLTESVPASQFDGMPTDRMALFGAALLAVALTHVRMTGGSVEGMALATSGVFVAVLVLWRVGRLLRERDVARRAVSAGAARDAVIAQIGRWALDERSADELLNDAGELLGDVLSDVDCTLVSVNAGRGLACEAGRKVRRFPIDDGVAPRAEIVAASDAGRADAPGEDDFLSAVAALLSAALKRRTAEDQLRHDALHDPLTGLPNRVLTVDRLQHMLAGRENTYVVVVFLDLDGFKAINDTHGHEAGDRVLCEIAQRLRSAVRHDDTVARMSGDEFVVIAASSDGAVLGELPSRLLAAASLQVVDGSDLAVSASVGVAMARSGTVSAQELLHRADAAMYRSKKRGGAVSSVDERSEDDGDVREALSAAGWSTSMQPIAGAGRAPV